VITAAQLLCVTIPRECDLFAATYRRFGMATVQFAVVEVEATVVPFDSGLGCTLNVQRVGKPRGWRAAASLP
jgi:hypothetical protein